MEGGSEPCSKAANQPHDIEKASHLRSSAQTLPLTLSALLSRHCFPAVRGVRSLVRRCRTVGMKHWSLLRTYYRTCRIDHVKQRQRYLLGPLTCERTADFRFHLFLSPGNPLLILLRYLRFRLCQSSLLLLNARLSAPVARLLSFSRLRLSRVSHRNRAHAGFLQFRILQFDQSRSARLTV